MLHDSCALMSNHNHVFMKKAIDGIVMAQYNYLPILAETQDLLADTFINMSMLFDSVDENISPERLEKLKKLSVAAQNEETHMARAIEAAQNFSWFDRVIRMLAQFTIAIACVLMMTLALFCGIKIGVWCLDPANSRVSHDPLIVLKETGPTKTNSELELSYLAMHEKLQRAKDLTMTPMPTDNAVSDTTPASVTDTTTTDTVKDTIC